MRDTKNYICVVEKTNKKSEKYNISGRYRVGAISKKEALSFLKKSTKSDNIKVCYVDNAAKTKHIAKRGECYKEIGFYNGTIKRVQVR